MVHTFICLGVPVAVDVNSGAVHVLDKTAYEVLSLLDGPMAETCPQEIHSKLPQYEPAVIDGVWAELLELQKNGLLFTGDSYIDPAAATLMAAFMIHGLTPGPLLFKEDGPTVYSILIGLVIANILMFVVGRVLCMGCVHITKVPLSILVPALAMTCIAGSYADANSMTNVYILLLFGLVAYVFSLMKIPAIPLILGYILGPLAESNLRKSLVMSSGSFQIFLQRPICLFFIVLTVIFVVCLKFDVKALFRKLTKKPTTGA